MFNTEAVPTFHSLVLCPSASLRESLALSEILRKAVQYSNDEHVAAAM